MYSEFLRINFKDISKGLVIAVLAAIFASMAEIMQSPDFSMATFNYDAVIKIAVITSLSYLSKNLISDKDGRVLGAIG